MTTVARNEMPPHTKGVYDQARALRLALAVFDDHRGRYDAAIVDAGDQLPELIYALVSNWVQTLVQHHGCEHARIRVERERLGIAEHLEEYRSNYDTGADQ